MVYPAGMIYTRKQEQEEHMRNWLWDRLRLPVSHSGSLTCESVFCRYHLLCGLVPPVTGLPLVERSRTEARERQVTDRGVGSVR